MIKFELLIVNHFQDVILNQSYFLLGNKKLNSQVFNYSSCF